MPTTFGQWFGSLKYLNLAVFVLDVLNKWADIFPGVELPGWASGVQVVLAALLSSVFGIGHRIEHGEAQAPANRTTEELTAAASVAKEAVIAAAPIGTSVTVPHVQSQTLTVTKADKV